MGSDERALLWGAVGTLAGIVNRLDGLGGMDRFVAITVMVAAWVCCVRAIWAPGPNAKRPPTNP